ncbi:MAG: hydrogenase iron-sulfur subunit [Proteobacteria bacterium]|nr:hydrogenase iron-sulfur subunit [Pseudomonadota bacterium]
MAGVSRLQYSTEVRLIRVMCTGRLDLAFLLRAFSRGADGVFIAGCRLNECNYTTQGNFYALSVVHLCKRLLEEIGLSQERIRIELISGSEGSRFADVVNDFSETIRALGPLSVSEGVSEEDLTCRLEAVTRLVPYIKVEKREKLRARLQTEAAYASLFSSDEIHQLLHQVTSYYVDPEKCQACTVCAKRCPVDAIDGGKNRIHIIDQEKCIKCGNCFEVCPPLFGAVTKISGGPVPPPVPEEKRMIVRKKKRES